MNNYPSYRRYEPTSEHPENIAFGLCGTVATGVLGVLSAYVTHPPQDSSFHVRASASHYVSDALTVVLLGLSLGFGAFTYSHFRKMRASK